MALQETETKLAAQFSLTRLLKDTGWRLATHAMAHVSAVPNLTSAQKDPGWRLGTRGAFGHTTESDEVPVGSNMTSSLSEAHLTRVVGVVLESLKGS